MTSSIVRQGIIAAAWISLILSMVVLVFPFVPPLWAWAYASIVYALYEFLVKSWQ